MIAQNDQKVHTGIAHGEMHEKCTKKMHTREVHARDAHAGDVREGSTQGYHARQAGLFPRLKLIKIDLIRFNSI